jgi:hypothetical protein
VRDLSISYERLGDLALSAGDRDAAHGHFEASLQMWRRLSAADPASAGLARGVTVPYDRLARLEAGLQTEAGRR